jgi:hypothetical protein
MTRVAGLLYFTLLNLSTFEANCALLKSDYIKWKYTDSTAADGLFKEESLDFKMYREHFSSNFVVAETDAISDAKRSDNICLSYNLQARY